MRSMSFVLTLRKLITYISSNRIHSAIISFLLVLLIIQQAQRDPYQGGNLYCTKGYCLTTPSLAVDMIIFKGEKSLAVLRKNEPVGLALVGGFVDVGETCLQAAQREIREETGMELESYSFNLLPKIYDDPERDPRRHTVSVVYWIEIDDVVPPPKAGDDAKELVWVERNQKFVFDHEHLLERAWVERNKYREKIYEKYNPINTR